MLCALNKKKNMNFTERFTRHVRIIHENVIILWRYLRIHNYILFQYTK